MKAKTHMLDYARFTTEKLTKKLEYLIHKSKLANRVIRVDEKNTPSALCCWW